MNKINVQDETSMLIITAYTRSNSCLTTAASKILYVIETSYIQGDSAANRTRHSPPPIVPTRILVSLLYSNNFIYVIFKYKIQMLQNFMVYYNNIVLRNFKNLNVETKMFNK
jgi:hypothetical protein